MFQNILNFRGIIIIILIHPTDIYSSEKSIKYEGFCNRKCCCFKKS